MKCSVLRLKELKSFKGWKLPKACLVLVTDFVCVCVCILGVFLSETFCNLFI